MVRQILKEARPATLVVTLLSTTLGIAAAYREGYIGSSILWDSWRIFLVIIAGFLLQGGTNLINNFFEEEKDGNIEKTGDNFLSYTKKEEKVAAFKVGIVFFIITAVIGLYLSYYSGWQLLVIEIIGIFSAYAYAGEPFSYKKLGLGTVMSFLMMGPLMVYASYFIFTSEFSITPILYSCALGLFIPAILLANELRDYEEDKSRGVGTLTVRIGFKRGKILYLSLICFAYINTFLLTIVKILPWYSVVILSTIPLLKEIRKHMYSNRRLLIPTTAKLYLIFGLQFLISLVI